MKTTMTRHVKGRERYYTLELIPNLFGETLLIRTYGSVLNLKATGRIQEIYPNEIKAVHKVELLIASKRQRGYHLSKTVQGDTLC